MANASASGDEDERPGLLATFPNLRGLEPLPEPEELWGKTQLPTLGPAVEKGVLGNGLTYFVQENREPKDRAALFLVVGFGSLVEEEHERGIAHIIEHLGFSATKDYQNHEIVKFLESIGAPFGACQNAYTTFDRTVYTLHIPTDKEGLWGEALRVLREFAFFTRISEEDLEKERKVVLEEWRESRSAQGRLFEQYITALCRGSKWGERLPIGKEDVIRNVTAQTLRDFYSRYYHPARMALIAVGDFDGAAVVQSVKDLFGLAPEEIQPLSRTPMPPERPRHAVPDSDGVTVTSSTDRELSFAQGMVDCKRPKQDLKSVEHFRKRMTEDLFHKVLGTRLLKLTIEPKGPRNFFMVSTETGNPIPPLNTMNITMAPLPGRMRQAIRGIAEEIERVKRFGFHEAEVDRAKRTMLADYEQEYIERDQRPSESFAEEYVSYFLDDMPAPGIAQRAAVVATIMPSISSSDIANVAQDFHFGQNVVVKLATPPLSLWNPLYTLWSVFQACWNLMFPRPKQDLPDSAEVAEILRGVNNAEALDPWPADADDVDSRLRKKFEACESARQQANTQKPVVGVEASGVLRDKVAPGVPKPKRSSGVDLSTETKETLPIGQELFLPNGMRVFLKDTDLFEDEIVLRARRWGGLSEYQGTNPFNKGIVTTEAQVCSMAAAMLGVCGMQVEDLQECLEGKRLEPNPPSMDTYMTGLDAAASPVDLETLLLLLHLMFLCPVDATAQSRTRTSLVKLSLLAARLAENRDPMAQFQKRLQRCISQNHPFVRAPTLWSILRLNFKTVSNIFNDSLKMPCEWTVVLVGRLPPPEKLTPLLHKYLGSIPNLCGNAQPERRSEIAMRESVKPVDIHFPTKSVKEDVKLNMIDPKGSTVLCFPIQLTAVAEAGNAASARAELAELFRLRILVRMLETRLVEVLRFNKGQVYTVSCGDDMSTSPPALGKARKGTLSIGFECDPAEADELVDVALSELDKLRDGSTAFTVANVEAAVMQERREFEECFQKNDWWAGTIQDLYFSRCQAVTEDIGASMSLWWQVRSEVVSGFSTDIAWQTLLAVLPPSAPSAVVAMRPKGAKSGKADNKATKQD